MHSLQAPYAYVPAAGGPVEPPVPCGAGSKARTGSAGSPVPSEDDTHSPSALQTYKGLYLQTQRCS